MFNFFRMRIYINLYVVIFFVADLVILHLKKIYFWSHGLCLIKSHDYNNTMVCMNTRNQLGINREYNGFLKSLFSSKYLKLHTFRQIGMRQAIPSLCPKIKKAHLQNYMCSWGISCMRYFMEQMSTHYNLWNRKNV